VISHRLVAAICLAARHAAVVPHNMDHGQVKCTRQWLSSIGRPPSNPPLCISSSELTCAGRHHDEDTAESRRHHSRGAWPETTLACGNNDCTSLGLSDSDRYTVDDQVCTAPQAKLLKEQLEVVKYRDADTGALRYSIRPVEGQLTFDKVQLHILSMLRQGT
jgi:hypothetical protein